MSGTRDSGSNREEEEEDDVDPLQLVGGPSVGRKGRRVSFSEPLGKGKEVEQRRT